MQTFMPSKWTHQTAEFLDNKRLHKQALEAWQILMVLTELDPQGNYRKPKGWANHPAVKMWRGNEFYLLVYIDTMVNEWKRRGFNSSIAEKAHETFRIAEQLGKVKANIDRPTGWLSDDDLVNKVTSTHRLALLAKNYEWYSQFNWPEDTGEPITEYQYLWPV